MIAHSSDHDFPVLALDAATIVDKAMRDDHSVLLFGPIGVGKSTLVSQIAGALAAANRSCWCINADPGSPAFGVPGSVSLGNWQQSAWQVSDYVALCTLDAGRFRLPLVAAVRSLMPHNQNAMVLVDSPGVVRGVAGRELLTGLVEATAAHTVLALTVDDRPLPLLDELRSLPAKVYVIQASTDASRPGKRVRAHKRTAQWDTYLADAIEQQFNLSRVNIVGTPPPLEETHAWTGRQLAVIDGHATVTMGEVQQVEGNRLTVSLSTKVSAADTLLIRDAVRSIDGVIETAIPYAAERFEYLPPADVLPSVNVSDGPRIAGRVGAVDVALVNGVFGDPLLHLRVRHQRRSILFDLGDGSRLPARIAHQVTDVFISHAHMDHISGFLWLLRSRIGDYPPCRLYGPPGLAQHIAGFINGILWDRVEDRGPCFEVMEFHNGRLQHFRLQAGYTEIQWVDESYVVDGVLLDETGYRICGTQLDHRGTPVMAYAFEPNKQLNIRKDRLSARGLEPGQWLNQLKQRLLRDDMTSLIQLPDGSEASTKALADELVLVLPGKKLVYASDFADTVENRQRLVGFAHHAHTFFCEASFSEADTDHAIRNGHLTTRACGEIASAAGVARLVPFHFSRRYISKPQQLYDEINRYCSRVLIPTSPAVFKAAVASDLESDIELGNKVD